MIVSKLRYSQLLNLKGSLIIFGFSILFSSSALAIDIDSKSEGSCSKALSGQTSESSSLGPVKKSSEAKTTVNSDFGLIGETETTDKVFQVSMEEYHLEDLVTSDPEKNLAVKHPFITMSAAQRLYSIVMSEGTKKENIRRKGSVNIYNLFSEPGTSNKGKIIVGQEPEIASVVDGLREAIRGSVKVPFLVGPHGTGKTLFQDIFRSALWERTLSDPSSYYFSYEWKNLDQIDGANAMGDTYTAPLHDSPLTLLPLETQEKVIEFSRKHNKKTEDVVGQFNPVHRPDPHSISIRESVLKHYAEKKGSPLTEKEIVTHLGEHITVRRKILGATGTAPVMDAQGRDYSQADLFLSKDPILSNIVENRSRNPLAWTYGIVPGANGSIIFLDEFPRNKKELRDMFLRVFESHEISVSGQTIGVDAFFIAAGNFESLAEMTEGGDAKAQADRLSAINYVWSTAPHEIAKTLLYMYGDVQARKLGEIEGEEGKILEKADLMQMFPRTLVGENIKGSDGRYEIWLGSGSQRVHVSPHTIMLIANITAATRIHFSGAEALGKEANFTANTTVYNHPVERIKYLNGELNLGESTPQELDEMSVLMKEGHFGLSSRDAAELLREAANVARNEEGELTPKIVLDTFRDMINGKKKKIELFSQMFGDKEEIRKMWHLFASLMSEQILLPSLRNDIFTSIAMGDELVTKTFDEVIREIIAVGNGKSEYSPANGGAPKVVKAERLRAVEGIYSELHKNNLDFNQIATMYTMMIDDVTAGGGGQRDSNLMEAIQAYYARQATETIDLSSLSHYASSGEGGERVGSAYNNLLKAMAKKGYTEVGMRQALSLVEVLESRIAQARRQKEAQQ